jgi:ubiquinone/menaquinone biosynthesis C-methylase UbiE
MRWLSNLWWRLVRFGFRLLYYELAFTYDIVSKLVSLGAWREWQRTAFMYLPEPQEGVLLELAHGTGNLQLDLVERGFRSVGYELSPQMGRLARKKLLSNGLPVTLAQGRAQELPFASGTFSGVISTFPTDFIFQDETLVEIHRVLVDAGVLVVVLSGTFEGKGPVRVLLEWLYRITGQRGVEADIDTAYRRIRDQLSRAGFDAQIVREPCKRSTALLVVGSKIMLPNLG